MSLVFPAHWRVLPFGEAVRDVTSEYSKLQKSEYLDAGEFPVVDQGKSKFGGYTNDASLISGSRFPAIIFGDHTRILKFVDEPFCLGADGAKVLEPKVEIDRKFLFYFLSSLNIESAGYSRHFKFLKEKEVPLPPLAEQKRLVSILDKADAIRRKRLQAIQLADDLLHAVFLDMFGEPVANPKEWELKSLADVCRKITDGTHHSPPIVNIGVPYVTAKHLKKAGLQFFDDPWYISKEDHRAIYSRCGPERGDVLYIKDGATTGLAAINEYDFEFSMLSSLALLKPDLELIFPEYLAVFMNSPEVKRVMIANVAGAAITRLTLTKIKGVRIPVPPIEMQKKFKDIYVKIRETTGKISGAVDASVEAFEAVSQKAFIGQL